MMRNGSKKPEGGETVAYDYTRLDIRWGKIRRHVHQTPTIITSMKSYRNFWLRWICRLRRVILKQLIHVSHDNWVIQSPIANSPFLIQEVEGKTRKWHVQSHRCTCKQRCMKLLTESEKGDNDPELELFSTSEDDYRVASAWTESLCCCALNYNICI